MVGTMYQIARIEAAMSAKHIDELESELTALRKEIKPLVVANDQLYYRCEAMDAELASYKHLIGRVRSYVDGLNGPGCHSLPQYIVGIDDLHAVLNENPDVAASDPTIDELKNRIHELRRTRDSLLSKLAKFSSVTPASIAEQQKTITDLKDELGQQNETVYDLGVKLEACKFDIKDRDNHIDELNHSHAKLSKQVSNDEYTIDTLRGQLEFERSVADDFRKIIREKTAKIENMEGVIEGDNVELSVRRQDLKVLLDVVDLAKWWKDTPSSHQSSRRDMGAIYELLVDYTKVRPVPEIKSAEQNSGISSIYDDGNLTIVSGPVLEAVRNLFECYENGEDWALFTREAALNVIDQCNIIDELKQVGHQKDGVILGLQHDCRAKDKNIEETKTDAQYLDNKCYDQQHIIYDVQAKLRLADETHESEFSHLAKKEHSQRDKLRRISALLSDDLPHHHLTSRLSLIDDIISEDLS